MKAVTKLRYEREKLETRIFLLTFIGICFLAMIVDGIQ